MEMCKMCGEMFDPDNMDYIDGYGSVCSDCLQKYEEREKLGEDIWWEE